MHLVLLEMSRIKKSKNKAMKSFSSNSISTGTVTC